MKYKFQLGDIVKHKTGGPQMIIIGLSHYWDGWCDWEEENEEKFYKYKKELGYLCRFFIPKSADIKVANAYSHHGSYAQAVAAGQGSYEEKNFFEYELVKEKHR